MVDEAALRAKGLVKGRHDDGVKILGDGTLTKALTVHATKFSESAAEKIQAAGGTGRRRRLREPSAATGRGRRRSSIRPSAADPMSGRGPSSPPEMRLGPPRRRVR